MTRERFGDGDGPPTFSDKASRYPLTVSAAEICPKESFCAQCEGLELLSFMA